VSKRRGAFPRVPFKSVLELVDGIQQLGHGDPVRRRTAFEHIGRSPDSSTSYTLNSAATSGYGVVKGGKNASHLELTPSGRRVAEQGSGKERRAAVLDILFDNAYFSALVDKYADRPMPQDSIVVDYLQREQGLEQTDAEACWSVAKDNIYNFRLYEESGGKDIILSRDQALDTFEDSDDDPQEEVTEETNTEERLVPANGGASKRGALNSRIVPQVAFNIQVVLPENATADVYNAIFQSMAVHLLGRNDE
jgi:hypothetical protein